MKTNYIHIRIKDEEKAELTNNAHKKGFDSVSAFLLWLYRKFGK